jgi:hypothetical protein
MTLLLPRSNGRDRAVTGAAVHEAADPCTIVRFTIKARIDLRQHQ